MKDRKNQEQSITGAPLQGRRLPDEALERVTGGVMTVHQNEAAEKILSELPEDERLEKALEKLAAGMTVNQNEAAGETVSGSSTDGKLATGMSVNPSADDPSGYQINERMRAQVRAMDQANYNAQNGSSMMKVAEGSVSSTVETLRTLKETVLNAVNDTATEIDRNAIQKEINASVQQLDDNALLTFNGKLLNTDARASRGPAAQHSNPVYSVLGTHTEGISNRNASGDNGVSPLNDANANQHMDLALDDMRESALGLSGEGATTESPADATAALKVIDVALQRALNQEASIGAIMNRLDFTSNNLTTSSENLQSAESTYRDADMAREMTEFTKNNILMQAGTAMLAQANQQNNGVLSLIQ